MAGYFDLCRQKRNDASYVRAQEVSQSEADELLEEAERFRSKVERWIRKHLPHLS